MPLFVVLNPGGELDDALTGKIRRAIREGASPRHVPDEIIAVPAIPHTRTGKKLEIPVKRILQGRRSAPGHGRGRGGQPGRPAMVRGLPDKGSRSHEDQRADPHDRRDRHRARARRAGRSARLRLDQLLAHRRPRFVHHPRRAGPPRPVGHLGHGGGPDLSPLSRLDGPDGRHGRRPVRRPLPARASAPVTGPPWAAGTDRTSGTRWPRCASTSRWSGPCWRAASRRPAHALELQLRVQRLQAPGRHPHLPGRACPRPCCAWPERSPTGWCSGPAPPPTSRTW